ncbi:hypothetical protein CXB51_010373 [Gossypium anomalum]|uniref:Homeobox domain-containing protein n=1 Tax=Gossypium anomalum TaxID=47600 RepID=A0A8J6D258_9ROSI|nr:hypothetical protein CXB51_010373 [Gossypium anomalum]
MDEIYGFYSMGDQYVDNALMLPENMIFPSDYQPRLCSSDRVPAFGSDELISVASAISEAAYVTPQIQGEVDISNVIKAKIASHPYYPRLLEAYIDCQKVGAPPEIARILDEILMEADVNKRDILPTCLGADPELDEFMETYCDMLVKYKSDISRPFDEATTFLNKIEMQLRNLCTGASITDPSGQYPCPHNYHMDTRRFRWDPSESDKIIQFFNTLSLWSFFSGSHAAPSIGWVSMSPPFLMYTTRGVVGLCSLILSLGDGDGDGDACSVISTRTVGLSVTGSRHDQTLNEGGESSEGDVSVGEDDVEELQPRSKDIGLKDLLLHRFGNHITTLKLEFSKKKKKGKLPKESRQILLEWWNVHSKWPYPTEGDKMALAGTTGLDPKQINNWFINQRKRHWKPSETFQMDDLSGRFFIDQE